MAKKIKGKDFFDASVQKSIDKVIQRLKEVDKEYGQLTKELEKNKASLKRYSQTNSKLAKTAEKTNAVMKEATAISKAQLKADAKLAMAESKQAKKLAETKEKIRAKNQEVKQSIALGGKNRMQVTAQNSSLKQLEKALAMNRNAYANMTAAERNNAKQGGRLNAVIKKQAASVDRLRTSMGQAQQRVGGYSEAMKKMRGGVMQARMKIMALVASFGMLIRVGKKSIEDYDNEIKAQKALSVALGKTSKKLEKQASALQVRTRYGNEEILQGEAYLAQMGATEKQIEKITPLILDMAEAQGMKANDAFKLMGKTLGSSTNALSRYGIQVEGAVGSDERLESAVASLTKAFKGQAEASAAVGTGAIQQLKNAYGDLREQIGRFILRGINPLVKGMKKEIEYRTKLADIGNRRKEIEDEWRETANLVGKLDKANLSRDDELVIIKQLQQIAPERFRGLENEKDAAKKAREELSKLNSERVQELVLLDIKETGADLEKDLQKASKKLTKSQKKILQAQVDIQKGFAEALNKNLTAGQKEHFKMMEEQFNFQANLYAGDIEQTDKYAEEVTKQSKRISNEIGAAFIAARDKINKLPDVKTLADVFGSQEQVDAMKAIMSATDQASWSIEETNKKLHNNWNTWIADYREANEAYEDNVSMLDIIEAKLEEARKAYNETGDATDDNTKANADSIEMWENIDKLVIKSTDSIAKIKTEIADLDLAPDDEELTKWEKILKLQEELRKALKENEDEEDQGALLDFWDKYGQAGMDAVNSIADVQQAFFNRKMEQHQADLNAVQEDYEARIEAAEGNAEEQDRLREEQRQAEKQIQEQILAEKQKQAKIDKQVAAFEAAINGAIAIIGAFKPPLGGPVLGALTAAAVAAQIAAIEARPIPQFYKGTEDHPGGASLVGERGKELYITPSGMAGITPDTATVMDFPKGTHIFTHEDTKRYLAGAAKEKKHDMQISQKDYTMYFKKLIRNTGKETNINVSGGNDDYKKRYVN